MKIILCGYGPLGLSLLKGLLQAQEQGQCQLLAVFRWSDALRKNAYKVPEFFLEGAEVEIARLCSERQISRLAGKGLNSYAFMTELLRLSPDMVLVGSWGEKLKAHVLNDTKALFINCHPSLLPAHRGPNPYASVILNDETETGVTFHKMAESIDSGPIILQRSLPVYPDDDGSSIRERCSEVARVLIPDLLARILPTVAGGLPLEAQIQDEKKASYFPALSSAEAAVDWTLPAHNLSRLLRARYPWNMAYTSLLQTRIRLYLGTADCREEKIQKQSRGPDSLLRVTKTGLLISTQNPAEQLWVKHYSVSFGTLRLSQKLSFYFLKSFRLFL